MARTTDDEDLDRLDPVIPTGHIAADGLRHDPSESPYDLVNSPWGFIERYRADGMAMGGMSALARHYKAIRDDAAAVVARKDEMEQREADFRHLCEQVAADHNRRMVMLDELEDLRQHNAQLRADNAELQERIVQLEEPISEPPSTSLPPDISAKQASAPPQAIGDTEDLPGISKDPGELPEPPLELETDAGGVPLSYGNVPTSYIRGGPKDQAGALPEELALPGPPEPEHKGQVVPQPISISLNER